MPFAVGYAVSRTFELDVAISLASPHIGAENPKLREFAHGVMSALSFRLGWGPLEPVLDQLKQEGVVPDGVAALYLAGQANMETWQRLASEDEAVQEVYWNTVPAFQLSRENPDDLGFAVTRLMQARRSLDLVISSQSWTSPMNWLSRYWSKRPLTTPWNYGRPSASD